MARYTITPWKHPSDLLTVRQQLYRLNNSSDQAPQGDLRRHAVDRIMAWKLRSNLPHAVESTALLIDAQLHHLNAASTTASINNNVKPGPTISEFSIRAVYAAAFTRFITGFCDIGRSKERGLEQSSMLSIAKQIGMPLDFVALRHEATHEELPGLRRLIGAAEEALGWLWMVYWGRLEEAVVEGGGVDGGEGRVKVAELLRGHRRERRDALRKRSKRGGDEELLIRSTAEECTRLCHAAPSPVAEVLVQERLLLPTNRTLGEAMDGAYMIWDELLQDLARQMPLLPTALIESIFASITSTADALAQRDVDKEAHAFWLIHLIEQTFAARVKADDIVRQCCLHPGRWTQFVGRRLLDAGDDGLREAWEDILLASRVQGKGEDASAEDEQTTPVKSTHAEGMEWEGADLTRGKWTRAIVPPSLPIGVVR